MQLIEKLKAHIATEQNRLTLLLARLERLEQLWDERVTRLLDGYPALAGDCAHYRDTARERVAAVQARLNAYRRALMYLPA